ncbi:MAG: hypothetical protein N3C59_10235 [Azovibrio sp.]|nr:hypothetical protein [Azovibrio sp.]
MSKKTAAEKRLDQLEEDWRSEPGRISLRIFTAADLRLLLESSEEVRELIRAIVQGGDAGRAGGDERAADMPAVRPALPYVLASTVENELRRQLDDANRTIKELRSDNERLADEASEERKRARDAERQIDKLRKLNAFGSAGEVLDVLVGNPQLAKRLSLAGVKKDAESAIRVVAVLAQRQGLERVFEVLVDLVDGRPVGSGLDEAQRGLLMAALAWHNHNWPDLPYRLFEPKVGGEFKFDQHKRSVHTPTGERVARLLVPGLCTAKGKVEIKPLVATD